jgi:hypothetical protein
MANPLTDMQDKIMAAVFAAHGGNVYLEEAGHILSMNNLREKRFVYPNAYSIIDERCITEEGKNAFFNYKPAVFSIIDINVRCHVFEDRHLLIRDIRPTKAERIVRALELLRKAEAA